MNSNLNPVEIVERTQGSFVNRDQPSKKWAVLPATCASQAEGQEGLINNKGEIKPD